MKTWFVYLINGKKIGTWANNNVQAEENLRRDFGNVPMKFLGISYGRKLGIQPEEITYSGMSSVDVVIATGMLDFLVGLR